MIRGGGVCVPIAVVFIFFSLFDLQKYDIYLEWQKLFCCVREKVYLCSRNGEQQHTHRAAPAGAVSAGKCKGTVLRQFSSAEEAVVHGVLLPEFYQ